MDEKYREDWKATAVSLLDGYRVTSWVSTSAPTLNISQSRHEPEYSLTLHLIAKPMPTGLYGCQCVHILSQSLQISPGLEGRTSFRVYSVIYIPMRDVLAMTYISFTHADIMQPRAYMSLDGASTSSSAYSGAR
jgi:hypothetical protein